MGATVNYDSRGEMTYDQWLDGDGEDEFLYMTRDVHDVLVCERDQVNIAMGRTGMEDPYELPVER